jgi:hypothetical protein
MKRILLIVVWIGCSFLNYGFTLGYMTRQFPYMENTAGAVLFSFGGPLSLVVTLGIMSPHHWRLVPLTSEQRWQIFNEEYKGKLSREYFERNYN